MNYDKEKLEESIKDVLDILSENLIEEPICKEEIFIPLDPIEEVEMFDRTYDIDETIKILNSVIGIAVIDTKNELLIDKKRQVVVSIKDFDIVEYDERNIRKFFSDRRFKVIKKIEEVKLEKELALTILEEVADDFDAIKIMHSEERQGSENLITKSQVYDMTLNELDLFDFYINLDMISDFCLKE